MSSRCPRHRTKRTTDDVVRPDEFRTHWFRTHWRTLWWRAPVTIAVLLCVFLGSETAALHPASTTDALEIRRGMALDQAIEALRAGGLEVFYTGQLVVSEQRVRRAPGAADAEQQLFEILRPFGLTAERREDVWFVVPDGTIRGVLAGTIVDAVDGRPVAGARVSAAQASTTSDAVGHFELRELTPGEHTLEARRAGYLPVDAGRIVVFGGERVRQNLALEPAPFVNEEILVVPSRFDLLSEAASPPLALSRDEVEALPHLASDVQRAFQLLPGNVSNDLSAQFAVRGGRTDELEITLDGQELYDGFHLKEYDNALSLVATESLSSASLRTGGAPAAVGDRLGGVLDLRTREPSRELHTELGLSALTALASSSGSLRQVDGGWLATARRGSIDLTSRLFGSEDPSFWDAYAKLDFGFSPSQRLRAHALRANDTLDLTERDEEDFKQLDTQYDTSYVWLAHQAAVTDRLLVETRATLTAISRERLALEDEEEQRFTIEDRRELDVFGVVQSWEHDNWQGRSLRWGWGVRSFESETDYASNAERGFRLISPLVSSPQPLVSFQGDLADEHRDLWLDTRFSATERLIVNLGLRVDDHREVDAVVWSPRLNLALQVGESGALRLGWGRFHQSQRAHELRIEDGEAFLTEPQRSSHAFLGYEKQLSTRWLGALRLELYDRRVSNPRPLFTNLFEPFNQFPEAEGDRVRLDVDHVTSRGLEAQIKGKIGEKTTWWLGYTAASTRQEIKGQRLPTPRDQPHVLSLFFARSFGPWQLAAVYRYRTGWPTTAVELVGMPEDDAPDDDLDDDLGDELDDDADDDQDDGAIEPFELALGELYGERLDDHHRLDLRLSRSWTRAFGEISFFLEIQNLLDRENLAGFDHVLEDGELVRTPERWPGIFPSLGVRVVF